MTTNERFLDVGYLATNTPGSFIHLSVSYRAKDGYYVFSNAVELEPPTTPGGFGAVKFGMFDGGMNGFKFESAARFSAKRLKGIALVLSGTVAGEDCPEKVAEIITKSTSAKGLWLAPKWGCLSKEAAFNHASRPTSVDLSTGVRTFHETVEEVLGNLSRSESDSDDGSFY